MGKTFRNDDDKSNKQKGRKEAHKEKPSGSKPVEAKKIKVRGPSLTKENYRPKPKPEDKLAQKIERCQHLAADMVWTGYPLGLAELSGVTFDVHELTIGNNYKTVVVGVNSTTKESGLLDAELSKVYLTIGQLRNKEFTSKLVGPGKVAQEKMWTFLRARMVEQKLIVESKAAPHKRTRPRLATSDGRKVVHYVASEPQPMAQGFMDSTSGEWVTNDGVVIHCWKHAGVQYAKVSSAPAEHVLCKYAPFIKKDYLHRIENGSIGHELREYLRAELRKIGDLPISGAERAQASA